MRSVDPIRLGQAAAVGLSEETQLAVALVVWGGFGATVVQVLEGPDQVHINTRAGTVYSLTGTASGRIFAAYLPERLVKAAIRRERDERPGSGRVGRLMDLSPADLAAIRRAGYASVDPTPVPGVNALSAPVLDHAGQIQMALTLIGAARSLDTAPDSPHLRLLQETALRVSRGLGFAGQALSLPD
nr:MULTISPECIES: IclR family transcriptional regulator C-terminal domain-containing protein [unclassified Pannonibacter]